MIFGNSHAFIFGKTAEQSNGDSHRVGGGSYIKECEKCGQQIAVFMRGIPAVEVFREKCKCPASTPPSR